MKLNRLSFLFCGLMACTFFSCEEDFDPNADYRETAIIYGLLDASEPVQYIKVNKAYLNTNTNALTIAANIPDSTQFYHPIEVKLEKLRLQAGDTLVSDSYILSPVTITNKVPGEFSYPEQTIYATQPNEVAIEGNDLFRVVVSNLTSGRVYAATSRVVSPFCVVQVGFNTINPQCVYPAPIQQIDPFYPLRVGLNLSPNADIYQATYQINYKEFVVNNQDTTILARKSTKMSGINNENLRLISEFGAYASKEIAAYSIYDHLNNVINTTNDPEGMQRMFEPGASVNVEITAGGHELKKYIEVNNSYSAITQSKPFYSNISNGAGLFSSRFTRTINGYISNRGVDSLVVRHPHLKFVRQ